MTATAARQAFVLEQFRAVKSDKPNVLALFGDVARKTEEPIETYFDNVADAQILLTERHNILGPARRRFQIPVVGGDILAQLDYSQTTPTVRLVDRERGVDFNVIVTSLNFDVDANSLLIGGWGIPT